MKLGLRLTTKRRAMLGRWLELAMPASTDPDNPERFRGHTLEESRDLKALLDDLYTDCQKGRDDDGPSAS